MGRRARRAPLVMMGAAALASVAVGTAGFDGAESAAAAGPLQLSLLGRFSSGTGLAGAEIVAFDAGSHRMFVTNGSTGVERLDIVDISNPSSPALVTSVALGRPLQSVAVADGLVAVALEGATRQSPGEVRFFDVDGNPDDGGVVGGEVVTVGALPDMVTFTPDGTKVVTADEGEPNHYCAGNTDPEGSVSIIDVAARSASIAGFDAYIGQEAALRANGVRIYGPNANAAQDIEPEYVAISADSSTAYATLQENNALATIDLASATVTDIRSLGYKDHGLAGQGFDPSDRDGPGGAAGVVIGTFPVLGMFEPDSVARFTDSGTDLLVMANEGDAREYDCFLPTDAPGGSVSAEDRRAGAAPGLDPVLFAGLTGNDKLGRLSVTTAFPATVNGSNQLTTAYSLGGRSITIRQTDGTIVWDSGDALEQLTAAFESPAGSARFNADWNTGTGAPNGFDSRSDNKGPEPEGLAVGEAYGRRLAFVGLERIGGVVVFDITDPYAPTILQYLNTSVFTGNTVAGTAGDVSPEGLAFVPSSASPTGKPLVLVANEVSGTTAILELDGPPAVSVGDGVVGESAGVAELVVSLGEASSQTVTVDYETVAGTADDPDDYTGVSGTVTFDPGDTEEVISVPIVDDSTDEPNELLTVQLGSPSNTLLGDATGEVTIVDDELPRFTVGDASVVEGGYRARPTMTFTLSLTTPADVNVTVPYTTLSGSATQAKDFRKATGVVTFTPGETSRTVTVTVIGDRKSEADETLSLIAVPISGVVVVDPIGTGTIHDDD